MFTLSRSRDTTSTTTHPIASLWQPTSSSVRLWQRLKPCAVFGKLLLYLFGVLISSFVSAALRWFPWGGSFMYSVSILKRYHIALSLRFEHSSPLRTREEPKKSLVVLDLRVLVHKTLMCLTVRHGFYDKLPQSFDCQLATLPILYDRP